MTDLDTEHRYDLELLEKRRERTRRVVRLIWPGIFLIVVLVSVLSYLANYMPLVGGTTWRTEGTHDCVRYLGEFSERGLGHDFRVAELACSQQGDRVVLVFTMANAGPLPVTITGIDTRMPPFLGEASLSVGSVDGNRILSPFRAFRLAKGEERWVELVARVSGCTESQQGSATNRFGWRVAYRVGPMARSDTYHGMQFRAACPFPDVES